MRLLYDISDFWSIDQGRLIYYFLHLSRKFLL